MMAKLRHNFYNKEVNGNDKAVLAVFALSMFLSATLLFIVQPMFAKMVLPLLGGSPSVWNTCMVFYQAALLAGYAYAHAAPRWLGVRRHAAVHLALFLLVIFTLPIGLAHGWEPPPTGSPILWLLQVLFVSLGLPFFLISTTAPLLQKWFASSGHPAAPDPYFLYGASNLGSLAALAGYPLVVEPYLRLADQAWAWAGGYLVLTGFILACAVRLWRSGITGLEGAASPSAGPQPANPGPKVWSQRFWWVLLAFAPSSLMLGVTTYLSTDIAAVPLLWVIPLAIYLLTFVLVFARRPILPHSLMVRLEPFLVIPIALTYFLNVRGSWPLFPLHLLAFFLMAMVCHGELVKSRPPASRLTEFYLWMSVGGVLGGIFNALIAPVTFRTVIEYPLIIVVACMLRPSLDLATQKYNRLFDFLWPLALMGLLAWFLKAMPENSPKIEWVSLAAIALGACFIFRRRPIRFGLGLGALMLAGLFVTTGKGQVLLLERNFFGQLKVKQAGEFHVLYHGDTVHGVQEWDKNGRREPLSYYSRRGPLGRVFDGLPPTNRLEQVAIVGLGTGTIACYGKPGQHFVFYEIDPAVESIARDPRFFTYLQDSAATIEVVLGDARLSLKKAPDSSYDLIILDAFNSDAIPLHLLTREALGLYLSKLKPGGIIAFHISNRYLDLGPMLGNLAGDAGLYSFVQTDRYLTIPELNEHISSSTWVVMARDVADLGSLTSPWWQPLTGRPGERPWTDDFSNILAAWNWRSFNLNKWLTPFFDEIHRGLKSLK
jgi:SAM-dependent methyltransferase